MITKIKFLLGLVLVLPAFFLACTNTIDEPKSATGTLVIEGGVERAVAVSEITKATVQVYGSGIQTPLRSTETVSSGKGNVTISNIPVGANRIVEVQAQDNTDGKITDYCLTAVVDINEGVNSVNAITWKTSVKGNIYLAALRKNKDVSNADVAKKLDALAEQFSEAGFHARLLDADKIAADFDTINVDSFSVDSYKRPARTVSITAYGYSGKKVQISDPVSSVSAALSADEQTIEIKNVLEGTWNVYVDEQLIKQVSVSGDGTSITLGKKAVSGIQIQVAKNLNYPLIYYWDCSDKSAYPNTTWPGIEMDSTMSNDDYIFNFENCTAVKLLITNKSEGKLCTKDIIITSQGAYRITQNGSQSSTFISNEPNPPSYSLPSSAKLGGTITITVTSDMPLISGSITIGGVTKKLVIGSNSFPVSDFTTVEKTLSVSGEILNDAGSTQISGAIKVTESTAQGDMPTEWDELRIYQVMVSSFQDGDKSIGYQYAYGPSGALTGGDLRGIINALDYIKGLGMNALWMTPIFDSSKGSSAHLNSTGYYTYNYFDIDPNFGTKQVFAELVEKAHEKGIAIILDGVFGHWGSAGVAASPSGKVPVRSNGQYEACDYPKSLDFFNEVASYWITEYKIDGWRFDQCYQVGLGKNGNGDGHADNSGEDCHTGGHNYWYDIRTTIKNAAAQNGGFGTDWGTLGYTVGEHWMGDATLIQKGSVDKGSAAGYGLQSCFDFPARYQLIQSLAIEESKEVKGPNLSGAITYTMKTASEKGYVHDEGYHPNLFVTNHDLVRLGNLLNWKFSCSPTNNSALYFGKHKIAMAIVGAYSGPITVYYGDEWGAYVDGYINGGDLGAHNDNVARSTGKISGFNANEQSVIDFTTGVMNARASHPALWRGKNETVTASGDIYVGKKTADGETITYIINGSGSPYSYQASGTDLITNKAYTGSCPAYSAVYILN